MPPVLRIQGLDHFVLRVRDLDKSLAFYRDVLGLPIEFLEEYRAGTRPFVSARIGEQLVDLIPDPTYDPAVGLNTGGFLHFCVDVADCDFDRIIPALKQRGVTVIEDQPMPRMGARGMGLALYIADPDGYIVELKAA
jgi:catechol 2,3-dioxygenase-like lactoylglutathione lyase family enzyme